MTRRSVFVVFAACLVIPVAAHADRAAGAGATSELVALGHKVLADLDSRAIGEAKGGPDDIEAIGPCVRPTAAERANLRKAVVPSSANRDGRIIVRFGCVERTGIVVDAAYDVPGKDNEMIGVWRVVRASDPSPRATLLTLADYRGLSRMAFSEFAQEVTVHTIALVDLDGDGAHDAVIGREEHEGGSRRRDVHVTTWLSATKRTIAGGAFSDWFAPVTGRSVAPFVFQFGDDRSDEVTLRCLQATGVVDVCPEVVPVRKLVRRAQIAHWFVDGHDFGNGAKVPDRELATSLLDELGIPKPAQAHVVATLPVTTPAMRVRREVARVIAPATVRQHGEFVQFVTEVDLRPGELAKLLGDEPCAPIATADTPRLVSAIAAWARSHDRAVLAKRHDDRGGHPCKYVPASTPAITASCSGGARGLVAATWHYDDGTYQLVREVVFAATGRGVDGLVEVTSAGWAEAPSAAGVPAPGGQLEARLYRHGTHLLAIVVDASASFGDHSGSPKPATVSTIVDGATGPKPPAHAQLLPFSPLDTYALDAVELHDPNGTTAVLYFDGTWHDLVTLTDGARATPPQPAARYVWADHQRTLASNALTVFDANDWASSHAARDALHDALVAYGADPATIARIDAEAASIK